jgi:hypothetical protein
MICFYWYRWIEKNLVNFRLLFFLKTIFSVVIERFRYAVESSMHQFISRDYRFKANICCYTCRLFVDPSIKCMHPDVL